MRLFIAINFDDKIKDELCLLIDKLKNYSVSGNFTKRENLHLTLVLDVYKRQALYAYLYFCQY